MSLTRSVMRRLPDGSSTPTSPVRSQPSGVSVEQQLLLHPDVSDAAVIGVPDARLGEVGKAYVVRRPGSVLTGDDLIAWARREMANYKVPRSVEFVGALPRNASGKVVKGELRDAGAAGRRPVDGPGL